MLENKKIWITGAGSGIGRNLALHLARMGNHVLVSGRDSNKLNAVAVDHKRQQDIAKISESPISGRISELVFDVSDDNASKTITKELEHQLGSLDLCIICAGHCEYIDHGELDVALFRRVFDVNVLGAVNTIAAAMPLLKRDVKSLVNNTERAQIVVVGSLSAVVGLPRAEAYGASKSAINYFCDSLRIDVAGYGIDVSVINPGFVDTPMTQKNDFPMPFLMTPDNAAQRIINAIEKRKRRLDFPRRLKWTLKAASMFPSLWYKIIAPKLSR